MTEYNSPTPALPSWEGEQSLPIEGGDGGGIICAPATAPGGAISIIRISGPGAITVADRLFHGRTRLIEAKTHTAHFGTISSPTPALPFLRPSGTLAIARREGEQSLPLEGGDGGGLVDEVLATVFRAPHSYTGEDSVELSCHGSSYIIKEILALLCANGCRLAAPGEFTQRAFLNGRLDLSQAEAVADLIASENHNQHQVAISQLRGGISTRLGELRDKLLNLTALLELELDFSDHEDLEFVDRSELITLAVETETHISRLASTFQQGQAIRNGIPVAIVGKTNVGKSTLLNALLGDERAIVSDIHGTTRDTVEDTLTINGQTFRLIDTAGLRHTDDAIELAGINRTKKKIEEAAIILHLADNLDDLQKEYPFPAIPSQGNQKILRILTKIDQRNDNYQLSIINYQLNIIPISAKQGTNIDHLKDAILQAAALPQIGTDPVITNARHHAALLAAQQDLHRAIDAMRANLSGDLIAEDLRLCITHLNTILGRAIESQDTLNTIFSRFCIGK